MEYSETVLGSKLKQKINRILSTVSQSKSPLDSCEIKLEILSDEISYDEKVSIVNGDQMLQQIPVDVITWDD